MSRQMASVLCADNGTVFEKKNPDACYNLDNPSKHDKWEIEAHYEWNV